MLIIHYNGSRFENKSLDDLFDLLCKEPLDGKYAPYVSKVPGALLFHGNFKNVSHAFSIEVCDKEIETKFITHLHANEQIRI